MKELCVVIGLQAINNKIAEAAAFKASEQQQKPDDNFSNPIPFVAVQHYECYFEKKKQHPYKMFRNKNQYKKII